MIHFCFDLQCQFQVSILSKMKVIFILFCQAGQFPDSSLYLVLYTFNRNDVIRMLTYIRSNVIRTLTHIRNDVIRTLVFQQSVYFQWFVFFPRIYHHRGIIQFITIWKWFVLCLRVSAIQKVRPLFCQETIYSGCLCLQRLPFSSLHNTFWILSPPVLFKVFSLRFPYVFRGYRNGTLPWNIVHNSFEAWQSDVKKLLTKLFWPSFIPDVGTSHEICNISEPVVS